MVILHPSYNDDTCNNWTANHSKEIYGSLKDRKENKRLLKIIKGKENTDDRG